MKKTALMLALALAVQTGAASAAEYSDVSEHWANGVITQLTAKGIIEGDKNQFRPDRYINVNEFLKMTLTAMNTEVSPSDGDWSRPYIEKALEKHLIYSD